MNRPLSPLCLLAACGLALAAACTPQPAEKKKPTNDYQVAAANVAPPANLRSVCYNDADLTAFSVRMVQQQLVVGALQCKGPDGKALPRRRVRGVRQEVQPRAVEQRRRTEVPGQPQEGQPRRHGHRDRQSHGATADPGSVLLLAAPARVRLGVVYRGDDADPGPRPLRSRAGDEGLPLPEGLAQSIPPHRSYDRGKRHEDIYSRPRPASPSRIQLRFSPS